MTPIQQLLLGVGASKKTYMDDVFSTFLYEGNSGGGNSNATQTINNGIDLSTEDGMVWFKSRTASSGHYVFDTVRGASKKIRIDGTDQEETDADCINSFNTNGFTLGDDPDTNDESDRVSWTFRKAPGFFTIVEWSGDGTGARQLAHDLGSVPGCIIMRPLSHTTDWTVYHQGNWTSSYPNPAYQYLKINSSGESQVDQNEVFNSTKPTASHITLGSWNNSSGYDYIAYVFAGGESTAATARSVEFDGSSDYLHSASSSDLTMGTGDFTVEGWIKFKAVPSNHQGFYQISDIAGGLDSQNYGQTIGVGYWDTNEQWRFYGAGVVTSAAASKITAGVWYHIAHVRSSGVSKLYVNGTEVASVADTYDYDGTYLGIGSYYQASFSSNAYISNFRVVKGTAVYTSSFRPPTEPLTNITNTKVLCCNNSSTTGKTVGPTLTASGTLTASSDSPFDDPAGFKFGDSKEEIIKCGSYTGSGSSQEIYIGFEPQWLLVKNASSSASWILTDSMRGIGTGSIADKLLYADDASGEDSSDRLGLTPTGFVNNASGTDYNANGDTYVYIAIRRPDGYVGKPHELGTNVFFQNTAASSGAPSVRSSNFAPDFALMKQPAASADWIAGSRLQGTGVLCTNSTAAESTNTYWMWDYMNGMNSYALDNSSWQGWMWKRHAGFDVVTYKGTNRAGLPIPHSLSKIPEMIWIKNRDDGGDRWMVYHKGLNGGSSPEDYYLALNENWAESDYDGIWNDTAPTSTHFTLGNHSQVNSDDDENYIAMLFASVSGISAVGSYSGSAGAGNAQDIGFQPRFLLIKRASDGTSPWMVFDTTRGINNSGDEKVLYLNDDDSQSTIGDHDYISISSDGFSFTDGNGNVNTSGSKYIYYAHA